ncbi:MAG: hypothetical protein ACI92G_004487 [Candidatus Pelagisphaera sp.]
MIFLVIEIRQNTEQTALHGSAVQLAAYQDLISQIYRINEISINNPSFAKISIKHADGETLSGLEREQMAGFSWNLFRHGDMAYYQYEKGIIDEERLRTALNILSLENNVRRDAWKDRRNGFTESYRNYIDAIVAKEEQAAKTQAAPATESNK